MQIIILSFLLKHRVESNDGPLIPFSDLTTWIPAESKIPFAIRLPPCSVNLPYKDSWHSMFHVLYEFTFVRFVPKNQAKSEALWNISQQTGL
jgi:hypothetical protein